MSVVAHKMHNVSFFTLFKECVAMGNQYFFILCIAKIGEKPLYPTCFAKTENFSITTDICQSIPF